MENLKLPYLFHTERMLNALDYDTISHYINETNTYLLSKAFDGEVLSNDEIKLLNQIDRIVDYYNLHREFDKRELSNYFFDLCNYMLKEFR